ncbi:hypothetical protein SDRG_06769 [Saprolegnia diclina VS20]|uniref:Uncharacterized protein n=1 Tax=Saprolegnia diclina (strain VS20) TaxID=1156394 RepID=T0QMV5_SAPDV|nr:hypothetical protein SDRG_06769 [Saprolegnia diclina VS20]EQC36031.1 hypothetical protein SDRG_06769 [Saprolegnia diclina VS20]|eukprot:XP_008610793.1 hypothetical protein SDRG_06769 [Saprolegnia diclina VS20]
MLWSLLLVMIGAAAGTRRLQFTSPSPRPVDVTEFNYCVYVVNDAGDTSYCCYMQLDVPIIENPACFDGWTAQYPGGSVVLMCDPNSTACVTTQVGDPNEMTLPPTTEPPTTTAPCYARAQRLDDTGGDSFQRANTSAKSYAQAESSDGKAPDADTAKDNVEASRYT